MFKQPFLPLVVLASILIVLAFFFPYRTSSDTAQFGGVSLKLEFALTDTARTTGLGGRTSIPEDYGMLFVFPKDDFWGFWMKDTLIPLDMFWLDKDGRVITIAENVSPATYPKVLYPDHAARYVLETAAGFASTHHISLGTPLVLKKFPIVSE